MNKVIYMDNNATTKVDEAVFEEMKPYFTSLYGNPSSMHTFGGQVGKKIEEARERSCPTHWRPIYNGDNIYQLWYRE